MKQCLNLRPSGQKDNGEKLTKAGSDVSVNLTLSSLRGNILLEKPAYQTKNIHKIKSLLIYKLYVNIL